MHARRSLIFDLSFCFSIDFLQIVGHFIIVERFTASPKCVWRSDYPLIHQNNWYLISDRVMGKRKLTDSISEKEGVRMGREERDMSAQIGGSAVISYHFRLNIWLAHQLCVWMRVRRTLTRAHVSSDTLIRDDLWLGGRTIISIQRA